MNDNVTYSLEVKNGATRFAGFVKIFGIVDYK
jgi:hypothetical protein